MPHEPTCPASPTPELWHTDSTIVRRVPPPVRAEIDRRLLSTDRQRNSVRAIHQSMALEQYGVTFWILRRYAAYVRSGHSPPSTYPRVLERLDQLPGDLRAELDRVLLQRPAGLRNASAIHRHFALRQYGISVAGLRTYARRRTWQHRTGACKTIARELAAAVAPPGRPTAHADLLLISKVVQALQSPEQLTAGEIDKLSAALARLRQTALREADAEAKRRAAEPPPPLDDEALGVAIRKVYGLDWPPQSAEPGPRSSAQPPTAGPPDQDAKAEN